MGYKYKVEIFDPIEYSGGWGFSWADLYYGNSLFQALKSARKAKKATNGAIRITWR